MINKERILDAWIMVEHLSEGEFNIDKSVSKIGYNKNDDVDFYKLFSETLSKKQIKKTEKQIKRMGIVVFFDIFPFKELIKKIREKYAIKESYEETLSGNKFRFSISFDYELKLDSSNIFFTESGYIFLNNDIPDISEFQRYEKEMKEDITSIFENVEDSNSFNKSFKNLILKLGCNIETSYIKVVDNIESEVTNLHSFYISDLNKAKTIDTENLNYYLFGNKFQRYNLDSKRESENFNPSLFAKILQPSNYPLGRFPSNTKFALSLMQQVAVNLAIGFDNNQIRSVNGPPGTGKTTLLKDIFAELVVKQSYEMAKLADRKEQVIKSENKNTKDENKNTKDENKNIKDINIGILPNSILENNIVVASSNNGAVQNIVNELPLCKDIDDNMIDELRKADYFLNISNRDFEDNNRNWGMFSLEGGKSQNMSKLISTLESMLEELKSDSFVSNPDVYKEFMSLYNDVRKYRNELQYQSDMKDEYKELQKEIELIEYSYKELCSDIEDEEIDVKQKNNDLTLKVSNLKTEVKSLDDEIENYNRDIDSIDSSINAIQVPKRSLFGFGKNKKNEELEYFNRKKIQYLEEKEEKSKLRLEKLDTITSYEKEIEKITSNLEEMIAKRRTLNKEYQFKKDNLDKLNREFKDLNFLDMYKSYDELQLFNPWFDEEYRKLQSRLFISALKVRKQFLYENRKNIDSAVNIWNNKYKCIDNDQLTSAAWSWINLAIPVISSTFASFSRMCSTLKENSIGHLFIDEAGQALPQASVGAIYRSKNVMVVGDPSQIKPVLTLDSCVLEFLCKYYKLDSTYLSGSTSTQTLVDRASQYGFYKDKEKDDSSWIGIPLWVHRRCLYPMFNISNEISYNGLMVQGNKSEYGKVGWYDIKGNAKEKFVVEQAEFLSFILSKMIEEDPEIIDKTKKDKVYVITPFARVASMLASKLNEIGFTRYEGGKPTNIGTVHTFQGKEAPIVFMVLGADSRSKGAASWAVTEPNMMNVAATRAKKEFYLIGDRSLYKGLGTDVVIITDDIIKRYRLEHPELVKDINSVDGYKPCNSIDNPISTLETKENKSNEREDNNKQNLNLDAEKERKNQSKDTDYRFRYRVEGLVTYVGEGKLSKYVYIKGDDGIEYRITESLYLNIDDADNILKKGNRISFKAPEIKNKKNKDKVSIYDRFILTLKD